MPHGRLSVVFGCGGDRDRGKRPEMGRLAVELADRGDRHRRQPAHGRCRRDPARGDGRHRCRAREIGDRREAIAAAVAALEPGDVLVIAGKGHERGQIVGDRILPFFDPDEARRAIAAADAGGGTVS